MEYIRVGPEESLFDSPFGSKRIIQDNPNRVVQADHPPIAGSTSAAAETAVAVIDCHHH